MPALGSPTAVTVTPVGGRYAGAVWTALTKQAADTVNGNSYAWTGREVLVVYGASAGTLNVYKAANALGREGATWSWSVGSGEVFVIPPLPAEGWRQTDGGVHFTSSVAFDLLVVRLPSIRANRDLAGVGAAGPGYTATPDEVIAANTVVGTDDPAPAASAVKLASWAQHTVGKTEWPLEVGDCILAAAIGGGVSIDVITAETPRLARLGAAGGLENWTGAVGEWAWAGPLTAAGFDHGGGKAQVTMTSGQRATIGVIRGVD